MKNMTEDLSWDKYAPSIISALNLKETSKYEWHGQCLNCGGKDRFWITKYQGNVKTHCRQCDAFEAINNALRDKGLLPEWKPNTNPLKAWTSQNLSTPYHIRKKLDLSLGDCRNVGGKLVITLRDIITGEERGTQTITNDKKQFNKGLCKKGAGTFIGQRTDELVVTEGYATGQAIHLATGYQVLFSLDANTIPKNVALLQEHEPSRKIIVAADADDEGKKAAEKAGVAYSLPSKIEEDWNDVFVKDGATATAAQFEQNLQSADASGFDFSEYKIIDAAALNEKTFKPIEFLVDGLIPAVGLAMISGAPKVGKSYFCLNLISQFKSN